MSEPNSANASALDTRLRAALAGTYDIERELGGGGMSRVFVAREVALDRRVVVKVLPDVVTEGLSRDRFRREILLSATLQHPNIIGVIAAGDAAGVPYFVMPLVEGESLRARLVTEGRLSIPAAVAVLRDVARALAYAHERGVVHRDIKPDNILLTGGAAVVADFGVAKALVSARTTETAPGATLTRIGMSLGTPAYMAPEQAVADPGADQRVDIYAFGIMAFEMLCGRTPFAGGTVSEIMSAHLTKPPEPLSSARPGVSAALHALVMRCLEKDPAMRPQSANEILKLLDDPAVVSGAVPSLAFASITTPEPAPPRPRRRWMLPSVAMVLLAAGAAWWGFGRGAGNPGASTQPPSIAVLPLVLVSQDTADAYLAAGITDEVMNALARIPGMRVASRLTARSLATAGGDPAVTARNAGVTMTLEGTVQRRGDRIRVTARLVNAADGFALWTQTYERTSADLFAVQGDIATSIATVIRADLARNDTAGTLGSARRETPDAQAYDEFLRGHYLLARRGATTLREAASHFERAVARDSLFARAHAGLAQTWAVLPLYDPSGAEAVHARAVAAAQRALALDSTLAPAHAALGYLHNAAWRWAEGRASLERAIALDSTDASARQWLGENLLVTGDVDAAAAAFAAARAIDRDSPLLTALQAVAAGAGGDAVRAVPLLESAIAADPSFAVARFMAGTVLIYAGEYERAVTELEEARRLAPQILPVLGALGHAYARAGRVSEARAILTSLDRQAARDGVRPARAKVLLALGDADGAVDALLRAAKAHDSFFASEPMASPMFSALRSHPRFAELLASLNLADSPLATRATTSDRPR